MDYMDRDSRYDILFETVNIGPVKAKTKKYDKRIKLFLNKTLFIFIVRY